MVIKDERFYEIEGEHYPRVTWILDEGFPKGAFFTQWVGTKGLEESERIKNEAAEAGTRIHHGVELLLQGHEISWESYSPIEWKKLCTFINWFTDFKPDRILAIERRVHSTRHIYAGTIDCIFLKDGVVYVTDWKSSKQIHDNYFLQVAAYRTGVLERGLLSEFSLPEDTPVCTAILRLGSQHKRGYEFKISSAEEAEEHFNLFLNAHSIFTFKHGGIPAPKHEEIPEKLTLKYVAEHIPSTKDEEESVPTTTK